MVKYNGVEYDFCGYATKNDIRCSDGRIIRKNAFIGNNGRQVPLLWNHKHDDPSLVLGHALLVNRDDGVYAYGLFNNNEAGKMAKEMVDHKDVRCLSIWANNLKQQGSDVLHGIIREISLVLAGANPGAVIEHKLAENVDDIFCICMSDNDEDAICLSIGATECELLVEHSCDGNDDSIAGAQTETVEEAKNDDDSSYEIEESDKEEVIEHNEKENEKMADTKERTIAEVIDGMDEDEKNVMYFMVQKALESVQHGENDEEGDDTMSHNIFDNDENVEYLSHDDMNEIFAEAKRNGSLREAMLSHGIENMDFLFPDAREATGTLQTLDNNMEWVDKVLSAVHKTPFSKVKTTIADMTEADARARGYLKGNMKKEQFFKLMKRTTDSQTVYKKQKFDRDDIIDADDIDVVAYANNEMNVKIREELARDFLIGDGRDEASEDKVSEDHIRPIWTDNELFTINRVLPISATATGEQRAKMLMKEILRVRKLYKGSGNPTFFTTDDVATDLILQENTLGERLYKSLQEVANAMRVKEIVPVPPMEGATRNVNGTTRELLGIMVNLNDYNVGTNKGGELTMFDDFDIDFNQYKYLLETRCSGALIVPYSAVAFEVVHSLGITIDPDDPTTTRYGKDVKDLQANVVVNDDFIQGTLKHVVDYTGFSGDPDLQSGNYLALKISGVEGATTTVEVLGGSRAGHPKTIDDDCLVVRVEDKTKEKLKFVSTLDGDSITRILSLSSLKCITE